MSDPKVNKFTLEDWANMAHWAHMARQTAPDIDWAEAYDDLENACNQIVRQMIRQDIGVHKS
jgi:hypothetical protein